MDNNETQDNVIPINASVENAGDYVSDEQEEQGSEKREPAKNKKGSKGSKNSGTVYRMMMFAIAVATLGLVIYIAINLPGEQSVSTAIEETKEIEAVDENVISSAEDNVSNGVMDTGEINDGNLTLEQIQQMSVNDIVDTYLISKTKAKKNSYVQEQFNQDEDYWYYTQDGEKASKIGVDVSSYQGDIDWKKVKGSGIEFAIIRVGIRGYGSGKIVEDEKFKQNIKSAIRAGLDVGVYFFSQAVTKEEAEEEAKFVCNMIKDYDIKYPVVYDTENITSSSARTNRVGLTSKERTDMAIEFCDYVESKGYDSMIYSNKRWFLRNLNLERLDNYNIWLAQYSAQLDYPFHFDMWQYSSEGKVPGIKGDVDLDIYFG